jgi:hypothetical protein
MPLLWQIQVFDRAGNTIGTLSKPPGGPIYIVGSPDAFALCIPDIRNLPAFFTDPGGTQRACKRTGTCLHRPFSSCSASASRPNSFKAIFVS